MAAPYWALANFKAFRFADLDLSAMRKALKKDPRPADLITLHFALGRALEDRGLIQQSFRHYAAGNQLQAAGFDALSRWAARAFVGAGTATLTRAFFDQRAGWGCPGPLPHLRGRNAPRRLDPRRPDLARHPQIEGTTEIRCWRADDGTACGACGAANGRPRVPGVW